MSWGEWGGKVEGRGKSEGGWRFWGRGGECGRGKGEYGMGGREDRVGGGGRESERRGEGRKRVGRGRRIWRRNGE